MNNFLLILSTLSIGSLFGVLLKSHLDKKSYRYTKQFELKELRYKAIMILLWTAQDTKKQFPKLKQHRPDIKSAKDLQNEIWLEYFNSMLFASDNVLWAFAEFIDDKSTENWIKVTVAMREDLYSKPLRGSRTLNKVLKRLNR